MSFPSLSFQFSIFNSQSSPRSLATLLVLATLAAGAGEIQVPPLPDQPDKAGQGLDLKFETFDGAKTDSRMARIISLYVPENQPPTPFLPAGRFKATWDGDLTIQLRDEYTFSAIGRGKVTVEINGKPALEASGEDFSTAKGLVIKLSKGKNHIVTRYESPEKGDAFVRINWSTSEFIAEPVPPAKFTYNTSAKTLRAAERLHEGRTLFGTLRCSKCHEAGLPPLKPGEGMPELATDAPSLAEAAERLKPDWIAQWVRNPRALRPSATMPSLLHDDDAAEDAAHIAAFLMTLGKKGDDNIPDALKSAELIAQGGESFAQLGCIGCHTLPSNKDDSEGRIPLRYVAAKYKPAGLIEFLKQPEKHYQWVRMPNFHFSDEEARSIAGFLLSQQGQTIEPPKEKGDAVKGKTVMQEYGCVHCHNIGSEIQAAAAPALKTIPADGWSRGCLGADEKARGKKAPDFGLTPEQRGALLAFAAAGTSSLAQEAPAEVAERRIKIMRCYACHRRDEQDDIWSGLEGEVADLIKEQAPKNENKDDDAEKEGIHGMVDQTRPSLTWTGEKLKPEWMAQFISGKVKYKPRTWLKARMPSFAQNADLISRGLAIEHGCIPKSPNDIEPTEEMAEKGRTLAGKQGGFSCIDCHAIGDSSAKAVFEAPGVNFAHVKERLLHSYFVRWTADPLRVEPGTKMPKFGNDGKTAITEILDGDANKQFEAIWHYLMYGDKMKAPEN